MFINNKTLKRYEHNRLPLSKYKYLAWYRLWPYQEKYKGKNELKLLMVDLESTCNFNNFVTNKIKIELGKILEYRIDHKKKKGRKNGFG